MPDQERGEVPRNCRWWNGGHDWSAWSDPQAIERIWDRQNQHRHCLKCNRYEYRWVPCKEVSGSGHD